MKSKKNKKEKMPSFVFLALLILSVLLSLAVRAADIMAQVLISDGNIKINQLAIYRVSLFIVTLEENPKFAAGTKFKFYLSDKVSLQTSPGAPNTVSICRRYFSTTETYSLYNQCTYDTADRFIQITLASANTYTDIYDFEVGFIKNPGTADPNGDSNFRIVIEDSLGNVQFDVMSGTPVMISPGDINLASVTPSSQKVGETCIYTF